MGESEPALARSVQTGGAARVPPDSGPRDADPRPGRRLGACIGRVPCWLLVLVGLAVTVRLLVMLTFSSTVLSYYGGDSTRYLRLALSGHVAFFGDPAMPAGYPAFLAALRGITNHLPATIAVQHVLGVLTGVLAYVAVRQTRVPASIAAVPAAVVLFSGDQIFLEHALLTETLWTLLLFAGLAAALRGMDQERLAWFVIASVLIGASALVRHLSLLVPALLALWAFTLPGTWRSRGLRAAAVSLPAVVVVTVYLLGASIANGTGGIGEMSGFNLYARVGQFADCREFTPPSGTRELCEAKPVSERSGPFYYSNAADAPLYTAGFTATPKDAKKLGAFARTAIVHQPWDYARTVGKDFLRYFAPTVGQERASIGASPDQMSFGQRTPVQQGASLEELGTRFEEKYRSVDTELTSSGALALLEGYQAVFRVSGLLLLGSIAITLAGLWRSRGTVRAGIVLFGGVAAYLLVAPPALFSYDARYAVAPGELLAAAAALGVWALLQHRSAVEVARSTR